MKWLDLFSGVGMYAQGLEEAGHEVIGFCEVDKFCHKILKKHWKMKPISWCIKSLNKALTESSAAFPAKMSAQPGRVRGYNGTPPEKPLHVQDSSGRWLKPFAWYDLSTGLWRTWQSCLLEGWARLSERWPPAGMMSNGIAWQRPPLAHPTIAPEHTFLPTIPASEARGSSRTRYRGSPSFRGAKTSEALRTCESDPQYLNPLFAEVMQGLPEGFTQLETETLPASSGKLRED